MIFTIKYYLFFLFHYDFTKNFAVFYYQFYYNFTTILLCSYY